MYRVVTHACVFLLVRLSGCDSVSLDGRIGAPLSREEASAFVGRWINNESEVIELRQTAGGVLTAGWLDWDEKEQAFVARSYRLDARRLANVTYFLCGADDDDDDVFGFVRVKRIQDEQCEVYLPDPGAFRDAVKVGLVDGTVVQSKYGHFNVRIRTDSPRTLQCLSKENFGDLYNAIDKQTFRRIKHIQTEESAE
jgi:hypothetical protein